jgi:hypothetical protein
MAEETVSIRLGIDWADRKHRWAMRVYGQTRIMQGEFPQNTGDTDWNGRLPPRSDDLHRNLL